MTAGPEHGPTARTAGTSGQSNSHGALCNAEEAQQPHLGVCSGNQNPQVKASGAAKAPGFADILYVPQSFLNPFI